MHLGRLWLGGLMIGYARRWLESEVSVGWSRPLMVDGWAGKVCATSKSWLGVIRGTDPGSAR